MIYEIQTLCMGKWIQTGFASKNLLSAMEHLKKETNNRFNAGIEYRIARFADKTAWLAKNEVFDGFGDMA